MACHHFDVSPLDMAVDVLHPIMCEFEPKLDFRCGRSKPASRSIA